MHATTPATTDNERRPARIISLRRWAAVAAAVLVGIAAIWLMKQPEKQSLATTTIINDPVSNVGSLSFDTIRNTGATAAFHRLQDGSTVHLEPNSYIWFSHPFPANKKEIFLRGAALFAVNKETKRPFSVYAHGIEVLDLGTVFSVATSNSLVKVKLIQGKVVVRPGKLQLAVQDIPLKPGEEFTIDTTTRQYAVHRMAPNTLVQDSKLSRDLTFNNTSLQDVFERLEKECNVTIHYNIKEVKDKAFTGALDAGSNTKNIIAMICMVNDLTYEVKNNRFHIHQ